MDLKEIGEKLVAHCNAGTEREALDTLYSDDAVSVEANPNPETGTAVTEGKAGIHGKHDWWDNAMTDTDMKAEGPFPHGDDRFAVIFSGQTTDKESGQRFDLHEVGVYTAADSKIVKEEFFYSM
ncbi:MAG: nuclear transport factor 2 family protein [Pseudomonadota bacterium]